jgi:hypothetical protein
MVIQQAFKALVERQWICRAQCLWGTKEQVITGGTIDKVSHLDADRQNRIGWHLLYLTIKELFDWRFMQTDSNWGNLLCDVGKQQTTLIDFGTTQEYSKSFVDGAIFGDCLDVGKSWWGSVDGKMLPNGLLDGRRKQGHVMRAHSLSGFTVGEPFWTKRTNRLIFNNLTFLPEWVNIRLDQLHPLWLMRGNPEIGLVACPSCGLGIILKW